MSKKNRYNNIADEECRQAVIFARVSSEDQSKGASIDAQLKSVEDYCKNSTPAKPQIINFLALLIVTVYLRISNDTASIMLIC